MVRRRTGCEAWKRKKAATSDDDTGHFMVSLREQSKGELFDPTASFEGTQKDAPEGELVKRLKAEDGQNIQTNSSADRTGDGWDGHGESSEVGGRNALREATRRGALNSDAAYNAAVPTSLPDLGAEVSEGNAIPPWRKPCQISWSGTKR